MSTHNSLLFVTVKLEHRSSYQHRMQGEYENRVRSLMRVLQEKEDKVRGGLYEKDYVNPKGNIWAVFGSSFIPRLRRVVFMVYFASIKAGSQNWDNFCSMFIDAWADARKPKTRLNTTLKILSSAFDVDFIECLNKADTHIRMDETHKLRNEIQRSYADYRRATLKCWEAKKIYDTPCTKCHKRHKLKQAKYIQALKEYKIIKNQHDMLCLKIENILICKAIPCVARIFNKLFHDYKGFNNAFVFHLINNIARQRAETTQKALN